MLPSNSTSEVVFAVTTASCLRQQLESSDLLQAKLPIRVLAIQGHEHSSVALSSVYMARNLSFVRFAPVIPNGPETHFLFVAADPKPLPPLVPHSIIDSAVAHFVEGVGGTPLVHSERVASLDRWLVDWP